MPTYQGLVLAQQRHHFRTIVNLFPEHTPEGSPLFPEEFRFAREHGINYVGNEQGDDQSGEAFIAQTLALAQNPSAWPILVHCHASMDRSPAWMGLYRFVVQGWPLADALREIECHRGLRPKASVTLLYNRVLPSSPPSARHTTLPWLSCVNAPQARPIPLLESFQVLPSRPGKTPRLSKRPPSSAGETRERYRHHFPTASRPRPNL